MAKRGTYTTGTSTISLRREIIVSSSRVSHFTSDRVYTGSEVSSRVSYTPIYGSASPSRAGGCSDVDPC